MKIIGMFNIKHVILCILCILCFFCCSAIHVNAACAVDEAAKKYSLTAESELFINAYLKVSVIHANDLLKRDSSRPVRIVFDVWMREQQEKYDVIVKMKELGFVLDNESKVDIDGFHYYLLVGKLIERDLTCIAMTQAVLWAISGEKNFKVDFVQIET
jgi:hypothetical protein